MSATIQLTGLDEVLAKLRALEASMPREMGGALYELAEEVMTESQRIVPVDFGVLKGSKFVRQPTLVRGRPQVVLGYGGQARAYAVVQHERLDYNHPGGGEAKYLEKPLMAMKNQFDLKIAQKLKDRLGL